MNIARLVVACSLKLRLNTAWCLSHKAYATSRSAQQIGLHFYSALNMHAVVNHVPICTGNIHADFLLSYLHFTGAFAVTTHIRRQTHLSNQVNIIW